MVATDRPRMVDLRLTDQHGDLSRMWRLRKFLEYTCRHQGQTNKKKIQQKKKNERRQIQISVFSFFVLHFNEEEGEFKSRFFAIFI
jgi:hypothetical protein